MSCATQIDYYGNEMNLHRDHMSLKDVEIDPIDPSLYNLIFIVNNQGKKRIIKKTLRMYCDKIRIDKGFWGYEKNVF